MKRITKVLVSIICLVLLAVFTTGCADKIDKKTLRQEQERMVEYTLENFEDIKKIEFTSFEQNFSTRFWKADAIINDKFEIKVSDLPNPVKDISEVKNLSQIKKLYENYFISELGRRTDYYSTLYEILGMYSGKDSNGQAILRIYSKIKSRNMYYDGKAVEYDYLELSNLMQNSNNEIISATRATITSDSNLNGEMNSQEMDSRLRLEGFSKIN